MVCAVAHSTALVHERNFDQSDYLRCLVKAVVGLWEHGPCCAEGRPVGDSVPDP